MIKKTAVLTAALTATFLTWTAAPSLARDARPTAKLDLAFDEIRHRRFIDLTHSFGPDIPHWPGFPQERVETIFTIPKDGFKTQLFTHVGQWGTHVDAPAHFHAGLLSVDQIDLQDFFLKLVVLDVHASVARDPDYVVSMLDVKRWEKRHGVIPYGAFVALRTDWSKRWPDPARMQNTDTKGITHYPGWSREVLTYLIEKRGARAVGHETTDTDPGKASAANDSSLESYVLGMNRYQVELMANLDQVPEAGSLIMISVAKPIDGTGFPARAIAILP